MPKLPQKRYIQSVEFPRDITMQPIGWVRSPYTERHGTPRQSQLQAAPKDYQPATATVELFEDQVPAIALKDLEGFDYVWLITWLHLNKHWNPTVTPPRGPKVKRGTLATRAPHRPNPIGLSAVRLLRVEANVLHVQGVDLLDQTPVLDLKPYVSYCDAFPEADCGYVSEMERDRTHEKDVFGNHRPPVQPSISASEHSATTPAPGTPAKTSPEP